MIGADDTNIVLNCIANGYRAVYAMYAIAYELQPISFHAQYRQKICCANGLVDSTPCLAQHITKNELFFGKIYSRNVDGYCCTPRFFS
jgi:cellulose synthase/poly-beta-1,6-N-acetylglucosamine synthase-like glycosyltransferase